MTHRPVTVTILPELKRKRQNNETVMRKHPKMCLYSAHRNKVETEEARASNSLISRTSSETEEERAS